MLEGAKLIGAGAANFQVDEIGRVVSVGDGIARVYGLNEIQAGEMVMVDEGLSFSGTSTTLSLSSTRSDAQSAPPEFADLFRRVCEESLRCLQAEGMQLPPGWPLPELVRDAFLDDWSETPEFLTPEFDDIMINGPESLLCQDLFELVDIINSTVC